MSTDRRTISTVEDLDALPEATVVGETDDIFGIRPWQKWYPDGWRGLGLQDEEWPAEYVLRSGPVIVLWEPEETADE